MPEPCPAFLGWASVALYASVVMTCASKLVKGVLPIEYASERVRCGWPTCQCHGSWVRDGQARRRSSVAGVDRPPV